MSELKETLERIDRSSRNRQILELLSVYCGLVEKNERMIAKYNKRTNNAFRTTEGTYARGLQEGYDDWFKDLFDDTEKCRERIIELMGLTDICKRMTTTLIFYRYGRRISSFDIFIEELKNAAWQYFCYRSNSPLKIEAVKTRDNAFLVSFDT